jgi:hypothetical protein
MIRAAVRATIRCGSSAIFGPDVPTLTQLRRIFTHSFDIVSAFVCWQVRDCCDPFRLTAIVLGGSAWAVAVFLAGQHFVYLFIVFYTNQEISVQII